MISEKLMRMLHETREVAVGGKNNRDGGEMLCEDAK